MSDDERPIGVEALLKELTRHGYDTLVSYAWVLDSEKFWSLSNEALLAKSKMSFVKAHRLCHLRREWQVGKTPSIKYCPAGEACPAKKN